MSERGNDNPRPKVSDAIFVTPDVDVGDILDRVLPLVDAIHYDGALPRTRLNTIPWHEFPGTSGVFFTGRPNAHWGEEPVIFLKLGLPETALAFVHEIGHLLDRYGIGAADMFTSEADPALTPWWEAVQRTEAYHEWDRLARDGTQRLRLANGRTVMIPTNMDHVAYATKRTEFFARSYAQFIATKSPDTSLRYDLTEMQRRQRDARVEYPIYWEDEDFVPIRDTLAELITRLGWMP